MDKEIEIKIEHLKEQLSEIKKIVLLQMYFLFFFLLSIIFFLLKINKL
jgi:hypothetical protein